MTLILFPANYWLADDQRVYSGPLQSIVTTSDTGYAAFVAAGNVATRWPVDTANNQTAAALQDVIGPAGMFVNLVYYAADARYRRASGGVTITSLSAVPFLTDPTSRNTVNSAYQYAVANPAHITNWKMSDGTFIALNNTQMTTVNNDMTTFVQACFTCEKNTVASISGGTITTRAAVDAAFAAISNVFP